MLLSAFMLLPVLMLFFVLMLLSVWLHCFVAFDSCSACTL